MSFDAWKFVEVKVEALTLSNVGFMVLLRGPDSQKGLPIFIGAPEAHSIAQAMGGGQFPRPLTHDLLKSVLDELGSEVVRVLVTEVQDGTFFARLVFTRDGEELETDSRPSDAIAMALRFSAPIFVDGDLWESTAVPFERQGEEPDPDADKNHAIEQIQNRLSEAVDEEKYEEAARLRDELKRLQGGN
jgi:bifunctional DNase/RNase